MQQSEAHGLTSSFYFVWDEQMPNLMPNIKLSTALLEICYLRYALEHEIGLHPSYNSYMDQDAYTQRQNDYKKFVLKRI